jgi:hypothetical protein
MSLMLLRHIEIGNKIKNVDGVLVSDKDNKNVGI